ncbi:hypothetical protein [Streptomyces ossamyceticus]|uniref:Uncharacterized protein n=1 Tax=Streptomyces ossamyceticus TaxID=249581 RepID=A0ABV2V4Y3_9ACTN
MATAENQDLYDIYKRAGDTLDPYDAKVTCTVAELVEFAERIRLATLKDVETKSGPIDVLDAYVTGKLPS